jgi:hypothetical protein
VPPLGAALGDHQVPVLADPVEVWAFGVFAAGALPEQAALGHEVAGRGIQLRLRDSADSSGIERGPGEVTGAVVVPGQVGVDAQRLGNADRIRPRTRRIFGSHQQVTAVVGHVGGDHPEPAVVIPQRRREDAARGDGPRDVQL